MSILVTADLHLSDNPRDAYRFVFMMQLPELVRKHAVQAVIILGDLTEEKDRHGAWLVNAVVDAIAAVAAVCPVIVVMGNHDYADVSSPFFALLGRLQGVTWVQHPVDSRNLPVTPVARMNRALFLPHTSNFARDWAGLKFGRYDWIFAHQTFNGANVGFGRKLEGIDPSTFGYRAIVVSGDIHVPQAIPMEAENRPKVVYVGAPYTVDFGDDYRPRFLLIEDDCYKSVPIKGVPRKHLIEFSAKSDDDAILRAAEQCQLGDIVKMRVHMSARIMHRWDEIKKRAERWAKETGVVLDSVRPVIVQSKVITKSRALGSRVIDDELIVRYAKQHSADETTLKVGRAVARKV